MSPGEINWEAYSHEELHRMLWQDADVADVSTVADEWTRHRAALDAHAEVLREQRTALLDGWTGAAAEEAATRLGALAERIGKISELAAAGQKAAQDSADALAAARAAMPPPPGPGTTMPAFAGLPSAPFALPGAPAPLALPGAPFGLPTAPAPFALPSAPAPFALPSAPTMPAGTSGFYFYFGAASADQQKAQAVRAMQTYESSLNGSGRLIEDARSNVPQAAATPRAAAVAQVKTPSSGGVPWQRLVGGSAATATRGPVIGGTAPVSQQLTPGMRAGVVFGQHGGIAATGTLTADARTASQNNAMGAPPAGAARKDEDQEHENQMPTLDHDLFAVTERVSPAVIGEEQ
ncbi:hypothetical protein [Lentzea flaviverrucosa]|uniref:PPE family protein n=1 Tax=Lentzea flaviverrucosa TaxID=200379 RepID=A0A1H9JGK9_9PSEU|nr:hypothetical protein [Lentzea flaviverrucosa]RDI26503.1 hypothetical protein DFR72_107144 [Lentzea flaviverrucosa]SEQ86054.1 hypothetical protein SAMN05216195_103237 [Lentzea flaviverrucosa]